MKASNPNPLKKRPLARRAPILAAAASILVTPFLFAQAPAPVATGAAGTAAPAAVLGKDSVVEKGARLYSIEFNGGDITQLSRVLREKFPGDNFVIDDSDSRVRMSAFELRNVRIAEIGRTVEFLTKDEYKVEIVEGPAGNIWRIGPVNETAKVAAVKMRAVAAPSLFADEKALADIQEAAEAMDVLRLQLAAVSIGGRGGPRITKMQPLKSQSIFLITGDEEGVDGIESLIRAAEQQRVDEAAAVAASVAANGPRMRAVLAPHVFAEGQRVQVLLREMEVMQRNWQDLNANLLKASGLGSGSGSAFKFALPWVEIAPSDAQKVFVLSGSEAAIAGMESLIRSAEQLAAEEDLRIERMKRAEAAKRNGVEEGDLKAAKQPAKLEEREQ